MRRMAVLWLVVGLSALATGCASAEGSKPAGAAAPDVPPPPPPPPQSSLPDPEDETTSTKKPERKGIDPTTPAVQCESLAKDKCEAPCSWDKLAEKCTQQLGAIVYE
jgi:hypothetical protein